ncbi:hypothetical protein JCM18750_38330 [Halostagnicola bangensis]
MLPSAFTWLGVRSGRQQRSFDGYAYNGLKGEFSNGCTLADSALDPPSANPTWVAIDETVIRINSEISWMYNHYLDIEFFERRGTDPATEFLQEFIKKHDLSDTEILVDGYCHLFLFRVKLSGHLNYVDLCCSTWRPYWWPAQGVHFLALVNH